MKHFTHNLHTKGFSIVETLIALAIASILLLTTTQVSMDGIQKLRAVRGDQHIHTNVSHIVDRIRHTIKSAETLTKISDSEVLVRFSDYSTTIIKKDGTMITIGGSPVTTNRVEVDALQLDIVGKTLRIQLTVNAGSQMNNSFSATTTLAQRN